MTAMPNTSNTPRRDLHAEITNRLIAAIEADPGKPQMPWRRAATPLWMPLNAVSQNAYNGINVVNLWVAAEVRGFTSPHWATFKQWREAGCQVRKGAKAELVIFYKEYDVEPSADDDTDDGNPFLPMTASVMWQTLRASIWRRNCATCRSLVRRSSRPACRAGYSTPSIGAVSDLAQRCCAPECRCPTSSARLRRSFRMRD